jgi:hypothetical protein
MACQLGVSNSHLNRPGDSGDSTLRPLSEVCAYDVGVATMIDRLVYCAEGDSDRLKDHTGAFVFTKPLKNLSGSKSTPEQQDYEWPEPTDQASRIAAMMPALFILRKRCLSPPGLYP